MHTKQLPPFKQPSKAVISKIQKKEARHKGLIAAIEPETGDYFLGKSILDAVRKGQEKYPHTVFYSISIGYPAVHTHHGGIVKL